MSHIQSPHCYFASVQRKVMAVAAWNVQRAISQQVNSYFGYWFSHWRA